MKTGPRTKRSGRAFAGHDTVAGAAPIRKLGTGIAVFDDISDGGLPAGRATVICGAAGTGKTIFALQTLCNAATARAEVGLFVTFEERPADILRNSSGFGWGIQPLLDQKLFLVDGRMPIEVMRSGDTDISGLLAGLGALATRTGAAWVVFDSLDAMLASMQSDEARRRELTRIHEWIEAHQLTCIITAKRGPAWDSIATDQARLSYLVDCVVDLDAKVVDTLSHRSLRIVKYRGSAHYDNEVPCMIGPAGFHLAPVVLTSAEYQVFQDRLSTGIPALDAMLGGGILRGSAVLVTGAPGTAKTSVSGRFVEAHCARGEKALIVCFDESPAEMVRNLTSIGVKLAPHLASGRLRMHGLSARWQSADLVAAKLHKMIKEWSPSCVVVDPISALIKGGGEIAAMSALLQIFQQCKVRGITLLLPCILKNSDVDGATSEIHASTVADVWIDLSYLVRAGERNRLLTVVKARGTAHSNQVRELLLSDKGIELTAPYTEEGEVLTGTLRWQKEQRAQKSRADAALAEQREAVAFESTTAQLANRISTLQIELQARHAAAQVRQSLSLEAEVAGEGLVESLRSRRGGGAQAIPRRGDKPGERVAAPKRPRKAG